MHPSGMPDQAGRAGADVSAVVSSSVAPRFAAKFRVSRLRPWCSFGPRVANGRSLLATGASLKAGDCALGPRLADQASRRPGTLREALESEALRSAPPAHRLDLHCSGQWPGFWRADPPGGGLK